MLVVYECRLVCCDYESNKIVQLYSCVVMPCATNLYTIRVNTNFDIILSTKYGLPFQNCGMYVMWIHRTYFRLLQKYVSNPQMPSGLFVHFTFNVPAIENHH